MKIYLPIFFRVASLAQGTRTWMKLTGFLLNPNISWFATGQTHTATPAPHTHTPHIPESHPTPNTQHPYPDKISVKLQSNLLAVVSCSIITFFCAWAHCPSVTDRYRHFWRICLIFGTNTTYGLTTTRASLPDQNVTDQDTMCGSKRLPCLLLALGCDGVPQLLDH